MNFLDIITIIGIPAIIVGLIYIGRKLQILDDVVKTNERIKNNVKVIGDALIRSNLTEFDTDKLQSYSPFQTTQKGIEFLDKIGFSQTFTENKEDFFEFIDEENPKTEYDIELAAIKSVLVLFDESYFDNIKDYLYNNPRQGKNELVNIAGIYIRDKYIEDRKKAE